jgi:hypothetical protein
MKLARLAHTVPATTLALSLTTRTLSATALALSVTTAALSGCVTTATLVKKQDVKLPLLIGAVVGDLVVTSIAASQVQDYSYGGSLATGFAITAVDFAVGCLLGGCSSLKL